MQGSENFHWIRPENRDEVTLELPCVASAAGFRSTGSGPSGTSLHVKVIVTQPGQWHRGMTKKKKGTAPHSMKLGQLVVMSQSAVGRPISESYCLIRCMLIPPFTRGSSEATHPTLDMLLEYLLLRAESIQGLGSSGSYQFSVRR